MDIITQSNFQGTTIKITGEIDLATSPKARKVILSTLKKSNVLVNLSAVTYIDSSGVASLVEGLQMAKENHKTFYLLNISQNVRMVLELSHLDQVFQIIEQSQ